MSYYEHRLMRDEVLEDLKNMNGNILEVENKIMEKYGKEYLEPIVKNVDSKQVKDEFFDEYTNGAETTEDFKDFFYKNNMQEVIWDQIKQKSAEQYKLEAEEFERNFPALSPEGSKQKIPSPQETAKLISEKVETIKKYFPVVDRKTIEYVLYNFSCQVPPTINYLRTLNPDTYVNNDPVSTKPTTKNETYNFDKPKPSIYRLYSKLRKTEDSVKKIPGREVTGPESRYSEIRKDADAYLQLFHIYLKNKQLAHSAGQHSEANKFSKLAEEYYDLYIEAKNEAVAETIKQR